MLPLPFGNRGGKVIAEFSIGNAANVFPKESHRFAELCWNTISHHVNKMDRADKKDI